MPDWIWTTSTATSTAYYNLGPWWQMPESRPFVGPPRPTRRPVAYRGFEVEPSHECGLTWFVKARTDAPLAWGGQQAFTRGYLWRDGRRHDGLGHDDQSKRLARFPTVEAAKLAIDAWYTNSQPEDW